MRLSEGKFGRKKLKKKTTNHPARPAEIPVAVARKKKKKRSNVSYNKKKLEKKNLKQLTNLPVLPKSPLPLKETVKCFLKK